MWNRRLTEPVVFDNGEVLRSLRDVRKFILALPEEHRQQPKWRTLADCLLNAARTGRADVVAIATEQLRHSLITAPLPPQRLHKKPPAASVPRLTKSHKAKLLK